MPKSKATTPGPNWGRRDYKVDVVIRAFHQSPGLGRLTEKCIASVLQRTDRELYELAVLFAPHDARLYKSLVSKVGPGGAIYSMPKSMGMVRLSNQGLVLSYLTRAPYVLFMDGDVTIPDGQDRWLHNMVEHLDRMPEAAAVGAMTDKAGTQDVFGLPQTYVEGWVDPTTTDVGKTGEVETGFIKNFCAMFRKDMLRELKSPGPILDEQFEPGAAEDVDLCARLRQAGYTILLAQDVFVHHDEEASLGRLVDWKTLLKQNEVKLQNKYGPKQCEALGIL